MSVEYRNIHGRKPTRGLRPWLLIPKVLAIGVYLGSLATAAWLWWSGQFGELPATDPRRARLVEEVGGVLSHLSVPALVIALVLGASLLLMHGKVMLAMRWLRVKLIALAILVPAGHLFMSSRLALLRQAVVRGESAEGTARQFGAGLVVLLVASVAVVWLGRLKPRLGQNWAARGQPATNPAAAPGEELPGSGNRNEP